MRLIFSGVYLSLQHCGTSSPKMRFLHSGTPDQVVLKVKNVILRLFDPHVDPPEPNPIVKTEPHSVNQKTKL